MRGIQFKGINIFSCVIFGHGLRVFFFLLCPPFVCGFCRLVRLYLRGSLISFVYHRYTLGRFLDVLFSFLIYCYLFIKKESPMTGVI